MGITFNLDDNEGYDLFKSGWYPGSIHLQNPVTLSGQRTFSEEQWAALKSKFQTEQTFVIYNAANNTPISGTLRAEYSNRDPAFFLYPATPDSYNVMYLVVTTIDNVLDPSILSSTIQHVTSNARYFVAKNIQPKIVFSDGTTYIMESASSYSSYTELFRLYNYYSNIGTFWLSFNYEDYARLKNKLASIRPYSPILVNGDVIRTVQVGMKQTGETVEYVSGPLTVLSILESSSYQQLAVRVVENVWEFEKHQYYRSNIRASLAGLQTSISINEPFTLTRPSGLELSTSSIEEEKPINTVIGSLSAFDPGDTLTWSVAYNASKFNILGNQLRSSVVFDYEQSPSQSVTVLATDSSGTKQWKSFTVPIINVSETPPNTPPYSISLSNQSIPENAGYRAHVADIYSLDAESNVVSYSITGGADASMFEIYQTSKLRLAPNVVLDFETKPYLTVSITALDAGGLSYQQAFSIAVNDVLESISLPTFQRGYWGGAGGVDFPAYIAPEASPFPIETIQPVVIPQTNIKYAMGIPTSPTNKAIVDSWIGDPRMDVPVIVINGAITELPPESVVRSSVTTINNSGETVEIQQKFLKTGALPFSFTAIEPVVKPTWDWSTDGSGGWDILQSL